MNSQNFLQEFKKLLSEDHDRVSDLEMTTGNFDDSGNLIKTDIPTITTDICEVGVYDNTLYCVVIIHSNSFTESTFNILKKLPNIKIYGFQDFNKTLYPTADSTYKKIEQEILNDKYLQIQFNYNYESITPRGLLEEYKKIKNILISSGLDIVNQLNKGF